MNASASAQFADQKYLSLESYRKDGSPVLLVQRSDIFGRQLDRFPLYGKTSPSSVSAQGTLHCHRTAGRSLLRE